MQNQNVFEQRINGCMSIDELLVEASVVIRILSEGYFYNIQDRVELAEKLIIIYKRILILEQFAFKKDGLKSGTSPGYWQRKSLY